MASEEINPWSVQYLEDFLFFCCPECNLRDNIRNSFIQHGLECHPKSREDLVRFIETEFLEHESSSFGLDQQLEIHNLVKEESQDIQVKNEPYDESKEDSKNEFKIENHKHDPLLIEEDHSKSKKSKTASPKKTKVKTVKTIWPGMTNVEELCKICNAPL